MSVRYSKEAIGVQSHAISKSSLTTSLRKCWTSLIKQLHSSTHHRLTGGETQTLDAIFSKRTPQQYWSGAFSMPLTGQIRITSYFATRRCYECPAGSKPTTYHGGMDMAVPEGTEVHAPADGKIVFAGHLDVRGNAIIIDHGMGVFSLFAHNSRLIATVGQFVHQGDVISHSATLASPLDPVCIGSYTSAAPPSSHASR